MLNLKKNGIVAGAEGSVDVDYSMSALKTTKLADMLAQAVSDPEGANYQMRDIETGEDRFGETKAFKIEGKRDRFSVFIADVGEGKFMLTQGETDDWEGRHAFVVTQQELDELLA